jgi:hypothetical protein
MLENLELTDAHATAIVEAGIEYDVYEGDEVPSGKKDRMEAAHDLVAFAIDAWVDDEVRPDSDDEETAEAGKQVQDILEWAGVEIDEENDVTFGDLPQIEGADNEGDGEEDGEDGEDGEGPFDANDLIDGYDDAKVNEIIEIFDGGDLSADEIRLIQDYERENGERGKILNYEVEDDTEGDESGSEESGEEPWEDYDSATAKTITDGLKALDDDDELEVEFAQYVKQYEGNRETPKKRVLTWLDKWLDAQGAADDSDDGDDNGDDGEGAEEPFEGYDAASAKQIKDAVNEAVEAENLEVEEVEAIIAYEESNKDRSSLLKFLRDLITDDDDNGDDSGEEEQEEEKPAAKSRSKGRKKQDAGEDIDLDDDEIEAMLPAGLAQVHVKSKMDEARKAIEEQGLSLPGAYEGEEPELPNDISTWDHNALSDLLAQFQNAHSTASTQAAQAHIWNNTYGEIAEYLENQNLLESDQSNDTKRKAEARTEPRVVFFRAKAVYYKNESERWRTLASSLDKKGAVVSRVGGFVEGDNAQEDRRAAKPSTRGAAKGATAKKDTSDDKPASKTKPSMKKPGGVRKPAAKKSGSKPTVKRR